MGLGLVLNRNRQVPAEDSPAFGAIAERFRRAGDLERAVSLCQEGLHRFPGHTSARVTLGWSYLDLGRYEEARAELEQVLKRAPDNLAAIRGLAELHDRSEHDEVAAMQHDDARWMTDAAGAGEPASHPAPSRDPADGYDDGIDIEADDVIAALVRPSQPSPVLAAARSMPDPVQPAARVAAAAPATGPWQPVEIESAADHLLHAPAPTPAPIAARAARSVDRPTAAFAAPDMVGYARSAQPEAPTYAATSFSARTPLEPDQVPLAKTITHDSFDPDLPSELEDSWAETMPDSFVLPAAVEAARSVADEGPGPWPPVIPDDPVEELPIAAMEAAPATPALKAPAVNRLNQFLRRVENRRSAVVAQYLAG